MKKNSDKRKKIHWYTFDVRQRQKSSVAIAGIRRKLVHLDAEDLLTVSQGERGEASRIV